MKILIVGEFSGFAKHLKNGFKQLGHDVIVYHSGDSWKRISGDKSDIICRHQSMYFLGHRIPGSSRLCNIVSNIVCDRQLRLRCLDSSLVIVINYAFIRENLTRVGVRRSFLQRLLKNGAKLIMSECGDGCALAYKHPKYYKMIGREISLHDSRYDFLLQNSHLIIPTIYMYYEQLLAYNTVHPFDISKVIKAIPLPITIDNDYTINTCVGRRIVIFHGIIRPEAKGTPFIKEAMSRLQEELPNQVECVAVGGLPYDEYIKLFDRVDILIDQTYGNGWGMNAIIGAMKGKCVLTSCGPENGINMGIACIPFIQIGPDSDMIFLCLKELVMHPERIDSIKYASRKFAVNYCDSKIIADRYLKAVFA